MIIISRNSCPAVSWTMFPPTYISCDYCCVSFVILFINLRHPRDFKSHTSRRGTLYILSRSNTISSIYILAVGSTPCGKRHTSRTISATSLQSVRRKLNFYGNLFGTTDRSIHSATRKTRQRRTQKRVRDKHYKSHANLKSVRVFPPPMSFHVEIR